MKITNQMVIQLLNGLIELEDKDMPVGLAFRLNRINAALTEIYKVYEKTFVKVQSDKSKVEDLLKVETDVEIEPIKISELIDAEISLSPRLLNQIDFLVDTDG